MCVNVNIHTHKYTMFLKITQAVKRMDLEVWWRGQRWTVVDRFMGDVSIPGE